MFNLENGMILKNAFRRAIRQLSKWYFMFGSIGGVIAFLLLGKTFFGLSTKCSVFAAIVFVVLVFLVLLVFYIVKEYRTCHISASQESLLMVRDIGRILSNTRGKTIDGTGCQNAASEICGIVQKYFNKVTSSRCSVCIMLPLKHDKDIANYQLSFFCRDSSNVNRDTKAFVEASHSVLINTSYNYVVTQIKSNRSEILYVCEDVTLDGFQSTIANCFNNNKLPYYSLCEIPIGLTDSDGKVVDLLGILSIDSDKKSAFLKRDKHLIALLQIVADYLSELLITYYSNDEDV